MSIYKRGPNYCVRIKYNNKDFRKAIGPDRKVAEAVQKELEKEVALAKAAGLPWTGLEKVAKARKPKTFVVAATNYLEERQHCKESTKTSYQTILKANLLPEFGNLPLNSITESQVRKFQSNLAVTVSASRTNTIMQLLRSIFDQAARDGEIMHSPCRSIRRIEEEKTNIDPLSPQELEQALRTIEVHYQPIFTVLAYTGARPNELLALRWNDIDWKKQELKISKGRVRGHESSPKTSSSKRTIPLLGPVEETLRGLKDNDVSSIEGYVFTNRSGQPLNRHLARIWARALQKAGIRHRPSYQLRHTFATTCLLKGMPVPYVAKLLGHSTIDTLIRHYAGWISDANAQQEEHLRLAFAKPDIDLLPSKQAV